MMFTVVIPVLNQHDTTERVIQSWFDLAKTNFKLLFIDNGSERPLSLEPFFKRWQEEHNVSFVRNEKNTGVFPTFQQGLEATTGSFIFYSHNDVEMKEYGWDDKLNRLLECLCYAGEKPGVCGMFGARRLGTPDIYRAPYHYTQLMRGDCITVPSMVDAGARAINAPYERVITLDGFSLIVSREMVRSGMNYKFDYESYPVHHNYDHDICLSSHFAGYKNFVLDIDCRHHGGVTSTREKWAEEMGSTDLKIHRAAHVVMYEKYRDRLPITVK